MTATQCKWVDDAAMKPKPCNKIHHNVEGFCNKHLRIFRYAVALGAARAQTLSQRYQLDKEEPGV